MHLKIKMSFAALLAMAATSMASFAEENFHVHYRVDGLNQDAQNLSGTLYLNIYNTSGQDTFDMVAWIPEPNQVTYDQRQIIVGALPDSGQVEVLDHFTLPTEMAEGQAVAAPVTWRLEFADALGTPHAVEVVGQEVTLTP